MSYREPQSWEDFRTLIAEAMVAAGYDAASEPVADHNVMDAMIAPIYRLWEQIEFDEGGEPDEKLSFWEQHEESVYEFLSDYAQEYSSRWNYEPGSKPEGLDIGRFARDVTSELIGRRYETYVPRRRPMSLTESVDPSGYDEWGAPHFEYFAKEIEDAIKAADKQGAYNDAAELAFTSPLTRHAYDGLVQDWYEDIEKGLNRDELSFWHASEGVISDLVEDLIWDAVHDRGTTSWNEDISADASRIAHAAVTSLKQEHSQYQQPVGEGLIREAKEDVWQPPEPPEWQEFRIQLAEFVDSAGTRGNSAGWEHVRDILRDVDYEGGEMRVFYEAWLSSVDEWSAGTTGRGDTVTEGDTFWTYNSGIIHDAIIDYLADLGEIDGYELAQDVVDAIEGASTETSTPPVTPVIDAETVEKYNLNELSKKLNSLMSEQLVEELAMEFVDMFEQDRLDSGIADDLMSDGPPKKAPPSLFFTEGQLGVALDDAIEEHIEESSREGENVQSIIYDYADKWFIEEGWWDLLKKKIDELGGLLSGDKETPEQDDADDEYEEYSDPQAWT